MTYLGIDVSKSKLNLCFHNAATGIDLDKEISNDAKGVRSLEKLLAKHNVAPGHACMEATGKYWIMIAQWLSTHGWKTSVVNPKRIKAFQKVKMLRQKTDKADARLIAEFCETIAPDEWKRPSESISILQDLTRARAQLVQNKVRLQLQLNDRTLKAASSALQSVLEVVKKQIKKLEEEIRKHVKADKDLQEKHEILVSCPGVGGVTANCILAELPDIGLFKNKRQVAAYAGISPSQNQSGTREGRSHICRVGNSRLRRSVYMASLSAVRKQGPLRDTYISLVRRGKPKKVALIAVARKLLHAIFGMLRNGEKYNPELTKPVDF